MRVVIFEPFHQGHRLQYVRAFTEAIADLGATITLATSQGVPETSEFRTHVAPVASHLTIDAFLPQLPESDKPLQSGRQRLGALQGTVRRLAPDHLYIPYADGLAQVAALARLLGRRVRRQRMEIEAVLMRGRFAYPRDSAKSEAFARIWLALTTFAPLDIVHALDPIPYEAIRRRGGSLARRIRLIPEPVEPVNPLSRREAREALGLPLDGRLISCSGILSRRKGADRLVRAFAAASLKSDDRLFLMGRMDDAVAAAVRDAQALITQGRLIIRNETVSDADLHAGLCAADLVCLPYPRHVGSSGIAVRTAAVGRPLLSSDYGWLGMVTSRFDLGTMCDCTADEPLARALPAALEQSSTFRLGPAASRFVQFHTTSNFARCVSARLRERLGVAQSDPPLSWEWVLEGDGPRRTKAHREPAALDRH
jgi:glycosyltransferase involved in cell wall biosynthesis